MKTKEKDSKKKTEENDSKKKIKIVLIMIGSLLILIGLFLFWFFNRKFDVTFKVNDSNKYVIQVKYNQKIKEKDIKTDKELGENFIDWYEVVSTDNDKEKLAKDNFDFSTKIKGDISLKAVYKGEEVKVETVTVTFDTKGGNKIDSVTINKGEELTLPENPTRDGYTFVNWELEDGTTISNKAKLENDTTLYANWKKKEEAKKEEAKEEEPKKEEKISLSLSRSVIHRSGNNTSVATAKVENASGDVTYSIDSNVCVSIDKNTGALTAEDEPTGSAAKIKAWNRTCAVDGNTVTVTATLPSGKSASAKLTIEKDLVLYASYYSISKHLTVTDDGQKSYANGTNFSVEANQTVTWTAKAVDANGNCTPVNKTKESISYEGNTGEQCTDGSYRDTNITATTGANQKITVYYYTGVN